MSDIPPCPHLLCTLSWSSLNPSPRHFPFPFHAPLFDSRFDRLILPPRSALKKESSPLASQEGNLTQEGSAHEIGSVSPKSGVKPKISCQGENEHRTPAACQMVDNEIPAPRSQEETGDGDGGIQAVGDASDRGASTGAEITWGGDGSVSSPAPLSPQGASPRVSGELSRPP